MWAEVDAHRSRQVGVVSVVTAPANDRGLAATDSLARVSSRFPNADRVPYLFPHWKLCGDAAGYPRRFPLSFGVLHFPESLHSPHTYYRLDIIICSIRSVDVIVPGRLFHS
jgi:hypothetical protein